MTTVASRTFRSSPHRDAGATWTAIVAATGVIFSAVYALTLYRRVVFGTLDNPALAGIQDLTVREVLVFSPLILGTLWLGVQPGVILNITDASVAQLTAVYAALTGTDPRGRAPSPFALSESTRGHRIR